jgi:hypothetical protein
MTLAGLDQGTDSQPLDTTRTRTLKEPRPGDDCFEPLARIQIGGLQLADVFASRSEKRKMAKGVTEK